jgi:hypothetical protein
VGAARPYVKLYGGLRMRKVGVGGGELGFHEASRDRVRVRRSGGGQWWRESIQVAEVWLMWRSPKWECCQVIFRRG